MQVEPRHRPDAISGLEWCLLGWLLLGAFLVIASTEGFWWQL
jgi:hypothetical protein